MKNSVNILTFKDIWEQNMKQNQKNKDKDPLTDFSLKIISKIKWILTYLTENKQ